MKKRYTEAQIAFALRQAASGTTAARDHQEDGCYRADILPLEEAVCRYGHRR